MDRDAHRQRNASRGVLPAAERAHGLDDLEAGLHRAPSVVLVRDRVTEIHQDAVALILRGRALEPLTTTSHASR